MHNDPKVLTRNFCKEALLALYLGREEKGDGWRKGEGGREDSGEEVKG